MFCKHGTFFFFKDLSVQWIIKGCEIIGGEHVFYIRWTCLSKVVLIVVKSVVMFEDRKHSEQNTRTTLGFLHSFLGQKGLDLSGCSRAWWLLVTRDTHQLIPGLTLFESWRKLHIWDHFNPFFVNIQIIFKYAFSVYSPAWITDEWTTDWDN